MTTYFVTPGSIPLDAFTQFAVHHKPNSGNPIGYFGTGLKYAVAIILRNGGTFRMWVGETEYEFYTRKKDSWGKEIETVRMRKRHGFGSWLRSTELPFSTDLGKNWGMWQAYREMLTNTIDEGGYVSQSDGGVDVVNPSYDRTIVAIECDGFDEAGEGTYLLHEDPAPLLYENGSVKVYDRHSKYLYYKGVRVEELPSKSWFTYDFKEGVTLSEDRSVMNQYAVHQKVASTLDAMPLHEVKRPFEDESAWFESNNLSFYSLAPYGTIGLVASAVGNKGGYYLRSFVSDIFEKAQPEDRSYYVNFNIKGCELCEYVVDNYDVYRDGSGTEIVYNKLVEWVSKDSELLAYVRERAAEEGANISIALQEWGKRG